jgi:hypothetical protein
MLDAQNTNIFLLYYERKMSYIELAKEISAFELHNIVFNCYILQFTIGTWHGTQVALKEIPDDLSHRGHVV